MLDVGVETLLKTFLTLPDSVSEAKIPFFERNKAAKGSFYNLVLGLQAAAPQRVQKFDLDHIRYYHNIRNTLYHQGTTVGTVRTDQLEGYAILAVDLLYQLLDVDLKALLVPPAPKTQESDDPVRESVEVELSDGRYRLDRLHSQSIQVFDLNTSRFVKPVKPFLRKVIEEKSLSVSLELKSGKPKNTRILGKDVIKAIKPSAWHGWVAGQKIRRDTLITVLSERIREGIVDEKNWAVVDQISSLDDEILVFEPVGKGWGNSPFNLNCWRTESGDPIK
jgi:hypothetical protein